MISCGDSGKTVTIIILLPGNPDTALSKLGATGTGIDRKATVCVFILTCPKVDACFGLDRAKQLLALLFIVLSFRSYDIKNEIAGNISLYLYNQDNVPIY